MSDERREEMIWTAELGRQVSQTIETKGWIEIIRPSLEQKKEQYYSQLREAREHTEFLIIQQSINAIDWLFAYIESTLALGEDSLEQLKSTRKDSQST